MSDDADFEFFWHVCSAREERAATLCDVAADEAEFEAREERAIADQAGVLPDHERACFYCRQREGDERYGKPPAPPACTPCAEEHLVYHPATGEWIPRGAWLAPEQERDQAHDQAQAQHERSLSAPDDVPGEDVQDDVPW